MRLASLVGDPRWFVQRRGANLLGRIASAEAVPLLQPLLRQGDPRVARAAVAALGVIQDPAAARAIQTVLRAATGEVRRAVIEALVAEKDPRVVPMLVRILEESEPLGKDHEVVIETIDALGTVGTDGAVPILVTMAQRRRLFGGKKLRALKEHSVDALARVGTAKAAAALRGRPRRPATARCASSPRAAGLRLRADGAEKGRGARSGGSPPRCAAPSCTRRRIRWSSAASTRSPRAAVERLQATPSIVIGFIGDEVVVDDTRLPRGTASLIGFARDLRDRGIEKITLTRGLSRADVGHLVAAFTDRTSPVPLPDRLIAKGVRHVTLGTHRRRRGQRRSGGHRGGAARLRHGGRDGRDAVERGEGRRPAGSRRGAEDHRRPGAAGRRRTARR